VQNKKLFDQLLTAILAYEDPKKLREFLKAILTPKELEEIPTRLQIIKLLKKGMPQREIAEKLGVGIATVTRGSSELKKGNFSDIE
jgi:TrpR family transcriptional regulator, trp operon repressor